jgi:hypothetical protein
MEFALKDPRGAVPYIVGVHGAFILFLPRYQTLLLQVKRDDNVRTLFQAIRDAFEFAEDADPLRNIKPESRQARILEEMLQCVFEIGKFIELYAKHVGVSEWSWPLSLVVVNMWFVGTRTWKNMFGQVDGEIEDYRTKLIRLRDDFLARAAVTTEITVLGMHDDVSDVTLAQ